MAIVWRARRFDHDSLSAMRSRSSSPSDALPADPLSQVLRDLRLSGVSYARCELTRPWGIEFPAQKQARFHFVAEGECWLGMPGEPWLELAAGDIALLPHGLTHSLAHRAGAKTRALGELSVAAIGDQTYHVRAGGGGPATVLACCSVSFGEPAFHPLLELMPTKLVVRAAREPDETLLVLLRSMGEEVLAERVGAATIMTRLADVVITRVVRAWVEARDQNTSGWLAAIRDPKIGRALAAMHRQPGHAWSVESLADVAQSSRSLFSERFKSVVGMSPARYLARWRMHLASDWLRGGQLTVAEAAARLGYDSEASFSRAFKRFSGVPPSSLRHELAKDDRRRWR
jgi:AraC-like DNA-binding protein